MELSRKEYFKKSLKIAWPAVLEFFFISIAGFIDTFMVSSMGPAAIAAIGLTTQPKFIALSVFFAINAAVSALIARRRGEKIEKRLTKHLQQPSISRCFL